jgi:hypothetical protein
LTTDPAQAVADYLRWQNDPSSVSVDTSELEQRLAASDDPLERLQLRSELERAQDVGPQLEAAFVAHASTWAQQHDVTAGAFQAEGVDGSVLERAGMLAAGGQSRRSPGTTSGRQRAKRISRDTLIDIINSYDQDESFTVSELQDQAGGGSDQTVRGVIADFVASGDVEDQGPDPDHQGRGRAPTRYRKR